MTRLNLLMLFSLYLTYYFLPLQWSCTQLCFFFPFSLVSCHLTLIWTRPVPLDHPLSDLIARCCCCCCLPELNYAYKFTLSMSALSQTIQTWVTQNWMLFVKPCLESHSRCLVSTVWYVSSFNFLNLVTVYFLLMHLLDLHNSFIRNKNIAVNLKRSLSSWTFHIHSMF